MGVGGSGQRQPGNLGELVEQRAQQAVIGAEVVAPFGHAVRLVDREQGERGLAQQFAEMRLAGPLGRDIEQVELTGAKAVYGLFAVEIGAGQRGGANAVGLGAAQLVVHQRDQRRDHHAGAREHDRRQLVRQ